MDLTNFCKPGPWGGDLTARAITRSGDISRGRTEGGTIKKVMGGVGKNHASECG